LLTEVELLELLEGCVCVRPVDTTPEEFEKGVLTPRMHQKYFVHPTPEEFKIAKIIGHFGFVSV